MHSRRTTSRNLLSPAHAKYIFEQDTRHAHMQFPGRRLIFYGECFQVPLSSFEVRNMIQGFRLLAAADLSSASLLRLPILRDSLMVPSHYEPSTIALAERREVLLCT